MKTREYTAAGGIVLDDEGQVLLIVRWVTRTTTPSLEVRLPKGHVEAGETDEEAALREVCEETGYCHLAVTGDLGTVVSEFVFKDEPVRRTEHYYLMRLTDPERDRPQPDSPQAEEARFQPRWVASLEAAQQALTFPSEQQFAARARELLAKGLPARGSKADGEPTTGR